MTVFGSKVCDINVIRCSAMVGGGGGGEWGTGHPPPPPPPPMIKKSKNKITFFFLHLFICFVLFVYIFFFACQLRAQSCTLMMIIPLTHYDNFATHFFQEKKKVSMNLIMI